MIIVKTRIIVIIYYPITGIRRKLLIKKTAQARKMSRLISLVKHSVNNIIDLSVAISAQHSNMIHLFDITMFRFNAL